MQLKLQLKLKFDTNVIFIHLRFFNDTNITIELPLNIDTVRNKQHGNENEHVSVTIRPLVRANIFRMELETRFANRNIFRRNYRY